MRVTVTPEKAKEWLENNIENNRRVSRSRVRRLAADMKSSRWRYNGETIKFDSRGRLVDGQHRLEAVIEAGVPVPMEVIEDVPVDALHTIDQGRARTAADSLLMKGHTASPLILGATTKIVLNYLEGYNPNSPQPIGAIDHFVTEFPAIEGFASAGMKLRNIVPPSPVMSAVFLGATDGRYANRVPDFLDGVATGANLSADDPRLAFRNAVDSARRRSRGSKLIDGAYTFQICVRAWNAFVRDRPLAFARYVPGKRGAPALVPDIAGAPRFGSGLAAYRSLVAERRKAFTALDAAE